MRVLLENLVENALRYAEDSIWIKAEKHPDGRVEITVENNGENINEEELEYIFTPFRKGNKGQFGLGLAIVSQIAELHEASKEAVNTDTGVRFTIMLPAENEIKTQKTEA
jgi:two-component system sensor histidine kinase CssS